ncbi:MAG: transcription antitermination factor NusB [Pseudomonadota bacterium]
MSKDFRSPRGKGSGGPSKPGPRKPFAKTFSKTSERRDDGPRKGDKRGDKKGNGPSNAPRDGLAADDGPKVFSDTPRGIAVRRAAADLLELVRGGMAFDEALSQCRSYMALGTVATEGAGPKDGSGGTENTPDFGRADRGFARAMASTALRRRGSIDHLIGPYLDRPLPAKAARVMDILRVSAAQTLFLETPHHAAVSLATELTKERRETGGYAALVNAIARKVAKSGGDKLAELPVRLDTPAWLWRQWERAFGPALSRKIAAAHCAPAPLDITLKEASTRDHWAETLGATALMPVHFPTSLRLASVPRDVTQLPGFAEGAWWVQDFSAHMPVASLGPIAGKSVLDLCAAPGGKTLQLAAAGARVTALDRQAVRMAKVEENLARTGLNAQRVVADAFDFAPQERFDIVLLDAPCTATGTIRRHPDIPWSKSADDVASMARVQQRLIDHALGLLNPGGTLVYSTCSLQAAEGEDQMQSALTRHPQIKRQPIDKEAFSEALKEGINRHGEIRLLPHMLSSAGGVDGFFCAHLGQA